MGGKASLRSDKGARVGRPALRGQNMHATPSGTSGLGISSIRSKKKMMSRRGAELTVKNFTGKVGLLGKEALKTRRRRGTGRSRKRKVGSYGPALA